jgi:tetratricopeptide (TPR) repeat protein
MAASPELVFPFRPEMTGIFSWADQQKPGWIWKYYEALIRWQCNQPEEAKALFTGCGTEPDFVPFYLAKAELFQDDKRIEEAALNRAYGLDPSNWRTGIRLARFCANNDQKEKALAVAGSNFKANPANTVAGLQYAQMLKLNGMYVEALSELNRMKMLPAEGDVDAHSLFRETNILCALEQVKIRKWKKALQYLQNAESWPENLFSGEPYLADNRITRFMAAYCYDKLKDHLQVTRMLSYIGEYKNPDGWTSSLGNKLTGMVSGGNRNYQIITEALADEKENDRDINVLKKFRELVR